jgi:hypothetical protein
MPRNVSGLLIYFDEIQRRDFIQEELGVYEPFSDTLSVKDWEIGQVSLALLGFSESTIDYIALAKKGKRVATVKFHVGFSGLVNLQSISVESLESRLNERIRPHFIKTARGVGGLVPEKTWLALIDAIKKERPNLSDDIDRLASLAHYSAYRLSGQIAEIFLQERDALGVALDIFSGNNKLRTSVLSEWAPDERSVSEVDKQDSTARLVDTPSSHSSFLKGIPQRFLQEESALQHDLFNWPGATPIHESGTSVFEQGDRRLEVIYANKNSLEHTLGVDLIYYHQEFDLFALVQYKLMRKQGEQMLYRPDAQLSAELARMDEIYGAYRRTTEIQSHGEYRLNDDGFMFKLVPNYGLRPASGELIRGMYLPRQYMHFLIGPNGPKGPKGGPLITFDTAPRYLTNSQFSAGINSGWIGTSGTQSRTVKDVVQQYYETGHALLVAYESSAQDL